MKPLLATTFDAKIHEPMILDRKFVVSPKLDGIRCIMRKDGLWSRSGKRLPNKAMQNWYKDICDTLGDEEFLDGEMVAGVTYGSDVWSRTQSVVMANEKDPSDLRYFVFDAVLSDKRARGAWLENDSYANERPIELNMPWVERMKLFIEHYSYFKFRVVAVNHKAISSPEHLDELWEMMIKDGFEGVMLRRIDGPYKHGRSTPNQAYLVKCKRWDHAEDVIVGFEELMHNSNEGRRDPDGVIRRSTAQNGLVGMDTLGAFVLAGGIKVGTGFTEKERKVFWNSRNALVGSVVRYKHLPSVGQLDRHPVFVALGDKEV